MTCASCAVRIEKRLNKLDGVAADVNYATEKATVQFDHAVVSEDDLVAAVEAAGYQAVRPAAEAAEPADDTAPLRRRLIVSAVLSAPVLLLAMVDSLQFENWQWLSLNLATPVVLWGAWPFHRAAWVNLRHGTATMDTLVSVGVLAAWLWSVYALFVGEAGTNGMKMPFELIPRGGTRTDHIYLEVAAVVTTFLLAGCSNSVRRPSPSSTATVASDMCRSRNSRQDSGSWSGPVRRSPPMGSSKKGPPRSTCRC